MAPAPDEVDVHHRVAAHVGGKEVEAAVAVQQQHREGRGEDREGRDDQQVGRQCGPAEDRHAHVAHAGRAHLEDRGREIDACQQRAEAGYLQAPEVVIHADAGGVGDLGQRRIGEPPGTCELADEQRQVHQQHAGGGEPEAHGVQNREGHVAHAQLQRHGEVHQPDHERHGDEEDHDRAVRGEDLIIVIRRQEPG